MSDQNATPPGWYYAAGDPPGTQRYWDGATWQGGPQPVAAAGAGVGSAVGPQLADPGKRIIARIIDFFVILIPVIIAIVVFGQGLAGSIVTFLIGAGYEIYLLGTKGYTVGKGIQNVKVVNADFSDINMETAAKRYAIQLVQVIPGVGQLLAVVLFIANLVLLFTDSERQVVWDKIAQTKVINN
ncbi:MAG: RDD family protein [Acidimicrobiales bacterium]|nr:RDD family protein [Acidimicrobiales bacterium]